MATKIYVTSVQPLLINDELCYDLFYVTPEDSKWKCLRIYNCYMSFMVARFPGLTKENFISKYLKPVMNGYKCLLRTDLRDSSYFSFDNNYDYFEIIGKSPKHLNTIYKKLLKNAEEYYSNLDVSTLNPYDKLFYENTETPFRYTSTTAATYNLSQAHYFLACKYNIPLIGGASVDTSMLDNKFPRDYLPTNHVDPKDIKGLKANDVSDIRKLNKDYNNKISKCIVKDETVNALNNIYMLSYDIETYTKGIDINSKSITEIAEDRSNEIICIGIGIFNLKDMIPEKRYCIISKDFDKIPEGTTKTKLFKTLTYDVKGEYNNDHEEDVSYYIIANNEKHLLKLFIDIIRFHKPQLICAFNNFIFDDPYIYSRMQLHKLIEEYLNSYSPYEVLYIDKSIYRFRVPADDMLDEVGLDNVRRDFTTAFTPNFREFTLKIDTEAYSGNKTVRAPHVLNVDIYKVMLKEDAKRFTQYGRGNLNSMLETYKVLNPYTNKQLSKTDMKINDMFDFWDSSTNIYEIALYCLQDAWICATMIIKRSKITDLIEMANTSNTTLSDSLYRADGVRVSNCILNYGYNEMFAVMDTPFEHRQTLIKNSEDADKVIRIGAKEYDKRVIVGGQVRQISAGRKFGIVASDYSAMYPSNKEASNVDSSSRVDANIIHNPEEYGLKILKRVDIIDVYGPSKIYYVKKEK